MLRQLNAAISRWRLERSLSPESKAVLDRDRRGVPTADPGAERAIEEALAWLARAQDHSASADGGVARHFDLVSGWSVSYPETTGYIVPTMIEQGRRRQQPELTVRARRMLDWLVSIQFPEGGFQGGMVHQTPRVPVTFNTGQILLGLAAGVAEFGDVYRDSMQRAADWLVATQDSDGKWSSHPTPFANPGLKTYETHVSWGLLEAARIDGTRGWGEAGLRQVRWAIEQMTGNGWPRHNCLTDPTAPLTHTLGYALRGILEAWRFSEDRHFLTAATSLGEGLLGAQQADGRLPGRLRADWSAAETWVCLTGNVQIADCWLMLFEATGDARWHEAGKRANRFVRRLIALDGAPDIRGAVAGSYPVDGGYGRLQFLNWAAKFGIDSWQRELDLEAAARP